jgi:hypothetical protein
VQRNKEPRAFVIFHLNSEISIATNKHQLLFCKRGECGEVGAFAPVKDLRPISELNTEAQAAILKRLKAHK